MPVDRVRLLVVVMVGNLADEENHTNPEQERAGDHVDAKLACSCFPLKVRVVATFFMLSLLISLSLRVRSLIRRIFGC